MIEKSQINHGFSLEEAEEYKRGYDDYMKEHAPQITPYEQGRRDAERDFKRQIIKDSLDRLGVGTRNSWCYDPLFTYVKTERGY